MHVDVKVETKLFEHYEKNEVEKEVIEKAAEFVADQIEKEVAKQVTAQVEAVVKAKISEAVERVLEGEVLETNKWGEPVGKKTFAALIREKITAKDTGYRSSIMEQAVKNAADKAFKTELAPEIKEAKKALRKMIDSAVGSDFKKALKELTGLAL